MQAVGELDEEDTDVLAHRQHELAEILRLARLFRGQPEPRKLGYPIDQARDLGLKPALDLRELDRRVLDHVVQECGDDARRVEPGSREQVGDRERMGDVGIAVVAPLRPVSLYRQHVGGVDQGGVRLGVEGEHLLGQLELANDERPRRRSGG